jgi:hypothetical protein
MKRKKMILFLLAGLLQYFIIYYNLYFIKEDFMVFTFYKEEICIGMAALGGAIVGGKVKRTHKDSIYV